MRKILQKGPAGRSPPKAYSLSAAIVDETAMRCARMPQRQAKWKSRASLGSSPAKCTSIVSLQVAVGSNV
jgi:hypothetical protein